MTSAKVSRRVVTTDAEMRRVVREAREREKTATKIVIAEYDAKLDAVRAQLSTGATLVVPRRLIPGFRDADSRLLNDLTISPGAESLWSDAVDEGVLLEQLLEIAAGADLLKVVGGRISGRQRSAAKADASRANGMKGGRPSLTMGAFIRELDERLHAIAPGAPSADRSGNPNPEAPAGASWHVGTRKVLSVKFHGASNVVISAPWRRGRLVERRIRSTADRLARELARELGGDAHARRA